MATEKWYGFDRIDFIFEGREGILVLPKEENRNGKWLLKTEYFAAFQDLERELVSEGYALAYLKNNDRWGTDADQRVKRDLCDHLHERYGLDRKCVLIGMSCGGFHAVSFASRYPAYVSLLYLDAPLLRFNGWSDVFSEEQRAGWQKEQMAAYGFSLPEETVTYPDQPIYRLKPICDNRLPVALVYGDADTVVDPKTNAEALYAVCKASGVPIAVWKKEECNHHPHGPIGKQMTDEIIAFIRENAL